MPNDPQSAMFADEQVANWVDYHCNALRPLRPLRTQVFARHLPGIFPWLPMNGWQHLRCASAGVAACPELRKHLDGIAILPTSRALIMDDGREGEPFFGRALERTIAQIRTVVPKVGVHFRSLEPRHIMRTPRTESGLLRVEEWEENPGSLYAVHFQLGRMHGGLSPRRAEASFLDVRPHECGLDPIQAGIILAVHYMEYGYVPYMRVDCRGATYDPSGEGRTYEDCPRVDGHGDAIIFDWNWENRARELHGTGSFFSRDFP